MRTIIVTAALFITAFLFACNNNKPVSSKGNAVCNVKQQTCPATTSKPSGEPMMSGVVVETIDASSYTYVSINTMKGMVWAVAPTVALKKGDSVSFDAGMPMENYNSKTLNRTFPIVYFTSGFAGKTDNPLSKIKISKASVCPVQSEPLPPKGMISAPATPQKPIDFSGIVRPANGKTVAELFAQKNTLVGKNVVLRGRIVKANYGILGKTWLHVQDGTGKNPSDDITVTTTDVTPKKGDLVLINGTFNKDKDIGSGYKFPVIVENAKITVEK